MDIQRTGLLLALAVVAYLILMQWNNDYHKISDGQPVTAQSEIPVNNTPAQLLDPAYKTETISEESSQNSVKNSTATQDLIEVTTDVFSLKINPVGGDIVQLDLLQYPKSLNTLNQPFQLFSNKGEVLYSANSQLVEHRDSKNIADIPLYNTDKKDYILENGQKELNVNLTYTRDNITYIKTYTFQRGMDSDCATKKRDRVACIDPKAYEIKVTYQINNNSAQAWKGFLLAQLKRNNAKDPSSTTATSMTTFLGVAYWTPDKPYTRVSIKDIDGVMTTAKSKGTPIPQENVTGGWVAWLQHYFVTAWIPKKDEQHAIKTFKDNNNNYIVGFTTPLLEVAAGSQLQEDLTLYAGPKLQDALNELSPGLGLTIDYGILSVIGKPIFWLLQQIHSILGNWGWSIIVLTIIIKLIFFPLSATSYKSMARMRLASPKMQAIKERYGDDRQKMSQAMMELYKKEKLNPLSGCLPILIQMPVFIALYWVLLESVEIRQAPWLGWIHDLSVSDPYFILPIIMGATMFLQQHLNPAPTDPIQAKMFKLMPIIFMFFFIWFPAGLVLYWVVNNILSITQQWIITKQIENVKK